MLGSFEKDAGYSLEKILKVFYVFYQSIYTKHFTDVSQMVAEFDAQLDSKFQKSSTYLFLKIMVLLRQSEKNPTYQIKFLPVSPASYDHLEASSTDIFKKVYAHVKTLKQEIHQPVTQVFQTF